MKRTIAALTSLPSSCVCSSSILAARAGCTCHGGRAVAVSGRGFTRGSIETGGVRDPGRSSTRPTPRSRCACVSWLTRGLCRSSRRPVQRCREAWCARTSSSSLLQGRERGRGCRTSFPAAIPAPKRPKALRPGLSGARVPLLTSPTASGFSFSRIAKSKLSGRAHSAHCS